ncbi:MAG: NUDIX domain-containing protein [Candidatus Nanoarchaeia archaeon]|nr:NUDIX domain-containing protein [Candidatus Nanoarchaeia archaeon]
MVFKKKVGAGIGVMIIKDNKILLGKRHDDSKKADSQLHGEGTWTMPGGKIEFGESFEEAAKREVFEETGIKLNKIDVICVNNDKVKDAHFVTVGLFSEDFENEPKVMEPNEITEWQWFELGSLPEKVFFPSEKILENYERKKFYLD